MSNEAEVLRSDREGVKASEGTDKGNKLNLVDLSSDEGVCTSDIRMKELSKVGPYLSIRQDEEIECAGDPFVSNRHDFVTYDTQTSKQVALDDIFKREDIFNAMMADRDINATFNHVLFKNEYKGPGDADYMLRPWSPHSFTELMGYLRVHDGMTVYRDRRSYKLPADAINRFAFDHLEGDKVSVSLMLNPSGVTDGRDVRKLDILLPVPPELKSEFTAASAAQGGKFLVKDSEANGLKTSSFQRFRPADH